MKGSHAVLVVPPGRRHSNGPVSEAACGSGGRLMK